VSQECTYWAIHVKLVEGLDVGVLGERVVGLVGLVELVELVG
jgi:hypothetical protein